MKGQYKIAGALAAIALAVTVVFNPGPPELHKRTWNANIYDNGNGTMTAEIKGKWVNYLDTDFRWKPIDTQFTDAGEYFTVTEAPFEVYVPKSSTEIAWFIADNQWDLTNERKIRDDPMTMEMQALDVSDVLGIIETGNLGWGEVNYVIYKGAYPDVNADLIYYVHKGVETRLKRLIRFNEDLAGDWQAKFRMNFGEPVRIKTVKPSLTASEQTQISQLKTDAIRLQNEGGKAKHIRSKRNFAQARALQLENWNGQKISTSKAISIRPVGKPDGMRGIAIYDFSMWDSAQGEDQFRQPIFVDFEKSVRGYILTKNIPAFSGVILPVYADDTTGDLNPDAHPETNSVDGYTEYVDNGGLDWATIRGKADANVDADASNDGIPRVSSDDITDKWRVFERVIMGFDTSSIGSDSTIDSGTFTVVSNLKSEDFGGAIRLVSSSPASNTAIVAGDFDSYGTANLATDITLANWDAAGSNAYTLNTAGKDHINKTGTTNFGLRVDLDADDAEPTWSASGASRARVLFADNGSSEPILNITFSATSTATAGAMPGFNF